MFKVVIDIPGLIWSVVNTQNIHEKIQWNTKIHAQQCCSKLNNGIIKFKDL